MRIRKERNKIFLKQFVKLRENIQNNKKILKFKKRKWNKLIKHFIKRLKFYKKYKLSDQNQYLVSKYPNKGMSIKKNFRNSLQSIKRFKVYYGLISNKYLKNKIKYIKSFSFKSLNIEILKIFESRLDVILFRSKLCDTIKNARQLISHRKVLVNSKITNKKSYILKKGDFINIKTDEFINIERNILNSETWPLPPKYLNINYKTMQIIFGDIQSINFSNNFHFHLNLEKVLINFQKK